MRATTCFESRALTSVRGEVGGFEAGGNFIYLFVCIAANPLANPAKKVELVEKETEVNIDLVAPFKPGT